MGIFNKSYKEKSKISCVVDLSLLEKAAQDGSDKALPVFEKPFRKRVEECWENFVTEEHVLRELIDNRAGQQEVSEEIAKLLSPAFADPFAEVGFNGSKYELILNLEGSRTRLFSRSYFKDHAPSQVLEHWDILVGRQYKASVEELGIGLAGIRINASDIKVWPEWDDRGAVLSLFCEAMVPLLKENPNVAYSIAYIMLDQAVGELAEMTYIKDLKFLTAPLEGEPLTLGQLMKDFCDHLSSTPQQLLDEKRYIELFSVYRLQPVTGGTFRSRQDIFGGSCNCLPLLNDFLGGRTDISEMFAEDGIGAGFIFFPLEFAGNGKDRAAKILDLRDSVAAALEKGAPDSFQFIGGATGECYAYIDFLSYDLREVFTAVIDNAAELFEKSGVRYVGFAPFRADGESVTLLEE